MPHGILVPLPGKRPLQWKLGVLTTGLPGKSLHNGICYADVCNHYEVTSTGFLFFLTLILEYAVSTLNISLIFWHWFWSTLIDFDFDISLIFWHWFWSTLWVHLTFILEYSVSEGKRLNSSIYFNTHRSNLKCTSWADSLCSTWHIVLVTLFYSLLSQKVPFRKETVIAYLPLFLLSCVTQEAFNLVSKSIVAARTFNCILINLLKIN